MAYLVTFPVYYLIKKNRKQRVALNRQTPWTDVNARVPLEITRAIRGSSNEKFYEKLGLKSLNSIIGTENYLILVNFT